MIKDNIKNCANYYGVHPFFEAAFDFIKRAEAEGLPAGRYEISGDELYAVVQEYDSKAESVFEGHRKYIDIQYIISGTELGFAADLSRMVAKTEYDEEKDYSLFEDASASQVILSAGDYGIYFPWDIHKPGVALKGEPMAIKKIVVKVKA